MRQLILLQLLLSSFFIQAQTPIGRTWFYNDKGVRTTIKERWGEDENGFKHGKYIRYDYAYIGNDYYVAETGNYLHGKKQGEWKQFYPNGEVMELGSYTNNSKVGKWKEYYSKDKKVFQEGVYVNNLREGDWINTNGEKTVVEFAIPQTTKGYKTVYLKGIPTRIFNSKGEDILVKQQLEQTQANKEEQERRSRSDYNNKLKEDYSIAMSKYEDVNQYYGDTSYLSSFLKEYPNADENLILKAKSAIKNKADNDAFYFAKNLGDYLYYERAFLNGIHRTEMNERIKGLVVNNTNDFISAINKSLEQGKSNEVIELSQVVLRYKTELHNSVYSPVVIYYSLALWSSNDKSKTIETLKPYWDTTIDYSDGSKKFKDKFFVIYDQYKKQLNIDKDKETYKEIKSL